MKTLHFYLLNILFTCCFWSLKAQHNITGQLKPKGDYQTMLLYKTEGAYQYYKASAVIDEEGFFGFKLPENFEVGMYRLVYNTQKNLYINIIYNRENISFVANPENVSNSITFFESKENSLLADYRKQINLKYSELDSIQNLVYDNTKIQKLTRKYIAKKNEIDVFQNFFEQQSNGFEVNAFIKSYKKSIPELPFYTKNEYFTHLKNNYLNHINFEDKTLQNSSFILDRLNEYVFDLNETLSETYNTPLQTNLIDIALEKIQASKFKNEIIYSLTNSAFDPYSSKYDILLNHLYQNYYLYLPETSKNLEFTTMLVSKVNVMIGKRAPNIIFEDKSLYEVEADSTLLIFWSTTCSHCLKEIPEIYDLLKQNENIKVILIGLEDEYSDWENVIQMFPRWQHLRANGKWENEYAKAYNIKSTPAFFLLDQYKMILAKPDKLTDLKALLFKK